MNKYLLYFLIFFILFSFNSFGQTQNYSNVLSRYTGATVKIRSNLNIFPGVILTDHNHCGLIATTGEITTNEVVISYYYKQDTIGSVIYQNKLLDISIIKPNKALPAYNLNIKSVKNSGVLPGTKVFSLVDLINMPLKVKLTQIDMFVPFGNNQLANDQRYNGTFKLHSAFTREVRGSGIIDENGNLVGLLVMPQPTNIVVNSVFQQPQNLLPSDFILQILQELNNKRVIEDECISSMPDLINSKKSLNLVNDPFQELIKQSFDNNPAKNPPDDITQIAIPDLQQNQTQQDQTNPANTGKISLGILARAYNQGGISGLQVLKVRPESPLYSLGIRGLNDPQPQVLPEGIQWQGHIIIAVNGNPVESVQQLRDVINNSQNSEVILQVTTGTGMPIQEVRMNLRQ